MVRSSRFADIGLIALLVCFSVFLFIGCGYDGAEPGNIISTTPGGGDGGGGGGGGGGQDPSINSVTPTTALAGDAITVTGTYFENGDGVNIGSFTASGTVLDTTTITCNVHADSYGNTMRIDRDGSLVGNTYTGFSVYPHVSAAASSAGLSASAGGTIVVSGTGFDIGTASSNTVSVGGAQVAASQVYLLAGDNAVEATFAAGVLTAGTTQVVRVSVVGNTSQETSVTIDVAP